MSDSPLTQSDLNAANRLIERGHMVPADLVARLLYDRQLWIERAYNQARRAEGSRSDQTTTSVNDEAPQPSDSPDVAERDGQRGG